MKDNVQALMDSTSKAQMVLPAVFKAIEDISKLSETYEKYTNDLRVRKIRWVFPICFYFPRKVEWKFSKLNF